MNRQPFATPPQSWHPRMTPWFARAWFPMIRREMQKRANIQQVEIKGLGHLSNTVASGAGVLITPNHSFHFDSYVLGHAAHEIGRPFHVMAAWQVFQAATPMRRLIMQLSGIFSIDRESADVGAFKRAVEILRHHQCPLVIFPEGDIYHTNDRVMPFREGAAAIALAAAKRSDRDTVIVPAAIKCQYVTDPTPGLHDLMSRLEQTLHWRPQSHLPLHERIYRFAEGLLALKELEYLGHHQGGTVQSRIAALMAFIVEGQESRHQIQRRSDSIPERVKELRQHHIESLNRTCEQQLNQNARSQLQREMEDLFFVIQLYSYPGDYVAESPTIERIAETLDKFEEDLLRVRYPTPRGKRHATVQFGEPIKLSRERGANEATATLTNELEQRVQQLLKQM